VPSSRSPRRGDIVRVRFDPVEGSEQAGERPALVISPDLINERSPVVLLAGITSRKTERIYAFEAKIEPPEGGLTLVSKVSLMQLRAVDKRRILAYYGMVGEETMARVEDALKVATGLTRT
jgi:mRNA interferase MazF